MRTTSRSAGSEDAAVRHFLLAAIYSACIATFFASLLRDEWKAALRLFGMLFGVMVGGVFVLGWLMYLLAP
jgi:hypothetical protein